MHPFRVQPEAIDRVICGNCGHPAWDHFISEAGAECDSRESSGACRYFALTGFLVTPQVLVDNLRVSQLA
jgi:hypothetical protein